MNLGTLIDSFTNQLPSLAVTIAVVWTRLHYIEKKIDSVIKGNFKCSEHNKIFEATVRKGGNRKYDTAD
jgi:hypothetical protein